MNSTTAMIAAFIHCSFKYCVCGVQSVGTMTTAQAARGKITVHAAAATFFGPAMTIRRLHVSVL